MDRPTRLPINSGNQGWDAFVEANFTNVFDRPFAIAQHAGNEVDLPTTFPAASYTRCVIWVNHTTLGWALYLSNGTAWGIKMLETPPTVADIPAPSGTAETKINELLAALRQSGIIL